MSAFTLPLYKPRSPPESTWFIPRCPQCGSLKLQIVGVLDGPEEDDYIVDGFGCTECNWTGQVE